MNIQPLRILFIEDEPADVELAQHALKQESIHFESKRVETKDELLESLATFKPDLIISDYSMQEFDGMQALKLSLTHDATLPFIVLTGSLNEETAVACIKAGATDYVLKDRLARLPFAIREALGQHSMRQAKEMAERALCENEMLLRSTVESAPIVLFKLDKNGVFQLSTGAGLALLGLKPGEVVGLSHFEVCQELPEANTNVQRALNGETVVFEIESRGVIWDVHYAPLYGRFAHDSAEGHAPSQVKGTQNEIIGMIGVANDITERKRAEEKLKIALAEKETLLQELYHRTRNNMQVISAMLELQTIYLDDERLHSIVAALQNRIQAMALAQQKLYQAQDLSHINLKEYINELAKFLLKSFDVLPDQVTIIAEMDDVFVLIDSAIPCGLIINELISNALKYAFPDMRKGVIRIQLKRTENSSIRFRIADNGVGVPLGFVFNKDAKLGLQSVHALVQNQLRGTVSFESIKGVACQIDFRDDLYKPRV